MIRLGGRGGKIQRIPHRCSICVMLAYHKRMGRGRVVHLCNRHERIGREMGLQKPDDWEAYVVICSTFGDVEVRNAFPE